MHTPLSLLLVASFALLSCSGTKKTTPGEDPQKTPASRETLKSPHGHPMVQAATREDFLKEFGEPQIALMVDFDRLVAHGRLGSFMKARQPSLIKDSKRDSPDKILTCIGYSMDRDGSLVKRAIFFADKKFENMIGVFTSSRDLSNLLGCVKQHEEDMKETTIAQHPALASKQKVAMFTPNPHLFIFAKGTYIKKLQVRGSLERGGAEAYFGESIDVASLRINRLPLDKMGSEMQMLVGTLKTLSATGWFRLPPAPQGGLLGQLDLNLGTAPNASRLVGFVTPLMSTPNFKNTIKGSGLEKAIAITAQGTWVRVSLTMSDDDIGRALKMLSKDSGNRKATGSSPTP